MPQPSIKIGANGKWFHTLLIVGGYHSAENDMINIIKGLLQTATPIPKEVRDIGYKYSELRQFAIDREFYGRNLL